VRIGVVNAGNIGRTLAQAWLRAGHDLLLAKDGCQRKLDDFIVDHPIARRGTPAQAVAFGDVVLFSVYWPRLPAVLSATGPIAGKIVIDTMNPLRVDEHFQHSHDLEFMARSSTTEKLQRELPDARVVKAFSTMPSQLLDIRLWHDTLTLPPVFLAGDDTAANAVVATLARDAGFTALDTGHAAAARSIEQLGVLTHQVGKHNFGGEYQNLAPAILRAGPAVAIGAK